MGPQDTRRPERHRDDATPRQRRRVRLLPHERSRRQRRSRQGVHGSFPHLHGLPGSPAPVTDQSCAATSSANTLIGVGCPHAPPSCANLHSARRSRRHRLPFPAGSFIEGFRTPATVQAASLRSAGIRNPQQFQTSSPGEVVSSFALSFRCGRLNAAAQAGMC
jgi:hypothetical protein